MRYPEDPNLQYLRGSRGGKIRRGYLAHYAFQVAAAAANAILANTPLADGAPTIVLTANSPDVPRVLSVKGSAAGMAGDVEVQGVDANGFPLQETFALNGSTAVQGTKAFAKVTKIVLPARTAAGNQVQVGTTNKLGLWHTLTWDSRLVRQFDGAADAGARNAIAQLLTRVGRLEVEEAADDKRDADQAAQIAALARRVAALEARPQGTLTLDSMRAFLWNDHFLIDLLYDILANRKDAGILGAIKAVLKG